MARRPIPTLPQLSLTQVRLVRLFAPALRLLGPRPLRGVPVAPLPGRDAAEDRARAHGADRPEGVDRRASTSRSFRSPSSCGTSRSRTTAAPSPGRSSRPPRSRSAGSRRSRATRSSCRSCGSSRRGSSSRSFRTARRTSTRSCATLRGGGGGGGKDIQLHEAVIQRASLRFREWKAEIDALLKDAAVTARAGRTLSVTHLALACREGSFRLENNETARLLPRGGGHARAGPRPPDEPSPQGPADLGRGLGRRRRPEETRPRARREDRVDRRDPGQRPSASGFRSPGRSA